jgi:glycosyltransferase involved in cell wall biosynthesis
MQLSVVVSTLNGRDRLAACLDALTERAPDAAVVVVNGPSSDGTSGMVHDRDDVDALVELSERNVNVARNAGIREATGDVVAVVDDDHRVEPGWAEAVESAVAAGADAVTGPTHQELAAGMTTEDEETAAVGGREVTYFDGGNVAFTRQTLSSIDGFDEYLQTGGARDAAHRLAGRGRPVEWVPEMAVRRDVETDGGAALRTDLPRPDVGDEEVDRDWAWKYRSLSYRLVKNYGLRPGVARRVVTHALADASTSGADVLRGTEPASRWLGNGRRVVTNALVGVKDGVAARLRDRSPRRNPNGTSVRNDRAVDRHDWR